MGSKQQFLKLLLTIEKSKQLVRDKSIIELKVIIELSKLAIAWEEHVENLQKEKSEFLQNLKTKWSSPFELDLNQLIKGLNMAIEKQI